MEESRAGRIAAWIGVGSLCVFLLSPFPQGAGRALLLAAHSRQPLLQLILPTLAAIALPAWVFQRRERLRIGWMFAWPGRDSRPTLTDAKKLARAEQ